MKKLFLFFFALVVSIGTAWADKTIYFNPGVWATDNPALAAYVWGTGGNTWIDLTTTKTVAGSTCYVFSVPDEYLTGIIFTRAETPEKAKNFDNLWNRTNNITPDGGLADNMLIKITGWGQADHTSTFVNIAMLGTATASRQTLPAVEGADGFTNTRWGTQGGTDTEWFQIAWDTPQTFNTVKIYCEGAMNATNAPNLAFDIQTSDDGTTWTNRKHVWGKNGGNSYITVVLNENVSAKYVRFQGVKQGQYGYSFWEFEVYNIDYSSKTLNSIEFCTYKDKTSIFTDGTIALSAIGKTADDEEIPTGAITWNNSTPTVGNVTNETFNALTVGTTTISATAGGKNSNEITLTVTEPQVLSFIELPHYIFPTGLGRGDNINASLKDQNKEEYLGEATIGWNGASPDGTVINGMNIVFGAAGGVGIYEIKADDGNSHVATHKLGFIHDAATPPTAAASNMGKVFENSVAGIGIGNPGWNWKYDNYDLFNLGDDNNALRIHNVGSFCLEYTPDATEYNTLEADIYVVEAVSGHVTIDKTNIANKSFTLSNAGQWNHISIPLTDIESSTSGTGKYIHFYFGAENDGRSRDVMIDNIYFLKEAAPVDYYVVGDMNTWKVNADYKMTLNSGASGTEYKFGPIALTSGQAFKVASSSDGVNITDWYPNGTGNNYTVAADGNYDIYFRPNGDGGDDWHYHVIFLAPTLVDEGTTGKAGSHKLTGTWSAERFAEIDATAKANSYDLTALTINSQLDMVGKTANPYCMFITSTPGQVNRNEVVWDATNNRYNGYAMILEETTNDNKTYDINTDIKPIHVSAPVINRFLPAGLVYTTVVLPFDYASIPNPEKTKTKVYEISSSSTTAGTTTVTFTEVNSLEAGKPYLVNSFAAVLNFNEVTGAVDIDWTTTNEKKGDVTAVGTFKAMTLSASDNAYVLPGTITSTGDLSFQKAGNVTVRPFRAYITVPAASGARINVVFNDATGIHAATTEQIEGIFNIYSIDGKLVRQNTESKIGLEKGIYIINGKKVVIK